VTRRQLWLGVLAAVGAVVLLLTVGVLWLLYTGGGRDFALARLQMMLAPAELTVERAEGPLLGPVTLHGVDYVDAGGLQVRIERLRMEYEPRGLFGRTLRITDLDAQGVSVRLPPPDPDAPEEPFRLPDRLPWPDVNLPLELDVASMTVRDILVHRAGETVFDARALEAAVRWPRGGPLSFDRLLLDAAPGHLVAAGSIRLDGTMGADLDVQLRPGGAEEALQIDVSTIDSGLKLLITAPRSGEIAVEIEPDLDWRLGATLEDLQLQRWIPDADPTPLDLSLLAAGSRDQAEVEGSLRRDGRTVLIEPSLLQLDVELPAVTFAPLIVQLDDGSRAEVTGALQYGPPLALDLRIAATELVLPIGEGEPARFDGSVVAAGPLDALRIELDGALRREALRGDVALAGVLGDTRFEIESLDVRHGGGRLQGSGAVDWTGPPEWQLDAELEGFDPGVFAAELEGRLDGRLRSQGRIADEGLSMRLDIDALRGTLRGRPLQAQGSVELRPDGRDADLQARFGDSRLRVQSVPNIADALTITLSPLVLSDLDDEAAGTLRGTLRIDGLEGDATISGRLAGSDLRWQDERIETLDIELSTPLDFSRDARIRLQARGLEIRGEPIDRLRLDVDGGFDGVQIDADLAGPRLALTGQWQGRRVDDVWSGELQSLRLRSGDMPELVLQSPGSLRFGDGVLELGEHCLQAAQGSACVAVRQDASGQQLDLRIADLPLALLEPWISSAERPMAVSGTVEGGGRLQLVDGRPRSGRIELRSPQGELNWLLDEGPQSLFEWTGFVLAIELQDGRVTLRAEAVLDDAGSLRAQLAGPSPLDAPEGALSGRIDLDMPRLGVLNLLPAAVVGPQGRLQAGVDVGGSWQQPGFDGRVELAGFTAEVPMLGLTLAPSRLTLIGDGQRIAIDGELHSGGGPLRVEGAIESLADAPQVRLSLVGTDVQLARTPLVEAVASPDLQASFVDGLLRLRGSIVVPSATLDLERIDNTVAASNDVVVMDPREDREQATPLPIDADVRVELGDKVLLKGFGFDGGIAGTVRVRELPGRPSLGRGSLTVRGDYTAYGQNLSIERGRINYASTPLDDPRLDLRVGRTVGGTQVGLDVLGSARDPTLSIWSDPAMDEGEALSLLLLGRPLRAAGSGDNDQLTQAALAVGGNLLAARLGVRMGFDTFEVANSESLGGAALTVGKFLSPRLHIGYGVALFGSGQVLTLRYLLTERFEIELESGEESRAAINYRIER
jgi:translocation and assembly module TamB